MHLHTLGSQQLLSNLINVSSIAGAAPLQPPRPLGPYHDLHGAPARGPPVHGHPLVDDMGHGSHSLCREGRREGQVGFSRGCTGRRGLARC